MASRRDLCSISPIAWEPTGNPLWPDASKRNNDLRRYAAIVAQVARERGLAYVDLFAPTDPLFAEKPGMQYTINGCHLNEAGDREVAVLLDRALFGETTAANVDSADVSEAAGRGERQVVGPLPGLPHAQRLVRLRRPPHVGHRNVSARVQEDPRDGRRARSVHLGPRARQVAVAAKRRDDRRADRAADAVRQSAAALLRARRTEIPDAGRMRQER